MDLVFAEEKYSKSGQLEKVRRCLRKKGATKMSGRPCVQFNQICHQITFTWIIIVSLQEGETTCGVWTFAIVYCKFWEKAKEHVIYIIMFFVVFL